MSRLLIISFDSVPDSEWGALCAYPNICAFASSASVTRGVRSVFLSNTYPVHCSVATGKPPREHGIISNTEGFPKRHPIWYTNASEIKCKTLWQAARAAGLSVASVLWPCAAGAKEIRYNVPEIPPMPGKNKYLANLAAGSKLLQLRLAARYAGLLDGVKQPALDNFVTSCADFILRRYKPDLTLVHLTAYDSLCHIHGRNGESLKPAFESLDNSLKRLLDAAQPGTSVIIFSDHSQLDVHTVLTPNDILVEMGLLKRLPRESGYGDLFTPGGCYIECCGGSAFFRAAGLSQKKISVVRNAISEMPGFNRLLTSDELYESGHTDAAFGFCVLPGYTTEAYAVNYRGNHGYPLDAPDYEVFYAVKGAGFAEGETRGGSLLDIAQIAARVLNIQM